MPGLQPLGGAEDAALEAHVLAVDDDRRILGQLEVQGVVDRLDEGHDLGAHRCDSFQFSNFWYATSWCLRSSGISA